MRKLLLVIAFAICIVSLGRGFITLAQQEDSPPIRDGYEQVGDMIVPEGIILEEVGAQSVWQISLWSYSTVYYAFDASVNATNRQRTREAVAEWAAVSDVQFVERTDQPNYVEVHSCDANWSYIGMVGGKQELCMASWGVKGIIMHEFGHALGLIHEHQRPDRDAYVEILFDNIQEEYERYFYIRSNSTTVGDYDFDSIMHYSAYAFTRNGERTIQMRPGYEQYQDTIGQRLQLSQGDIDGINTIYVPAMTTPPPHDNAVNSKVIDSLPYTDTTFTVGATDDREAPCGMDSTKTVWYRYTATLDGVLGISTAGSDFDTTLATWTGSPGNLTAIACSEFSWDTSVGATIYQPVTSGQTYYIQAGGIDGYYTPYGNLMLSVEWYPLPEHDDVANSRVIDATPYTDTTITAGATSDLTPPCGGGVDKTVWYRYNASADGVLSLSTLGSDYDTILAVWNGSPGSLSAIACSNDTTYEWPYSQLALSVIAGQTYYIQVGGDDGRAGLLVLTARLYLSDDLSHDDVTHSKIIGTLPYTDDVTTILATDDLYPSCISGGISKTVWYQYTATTDGALYVESTGSDFDTQLALWTGTPGLLTSVACGENTDEGHSVAYPVTAGETYYIQAGGYDGSSGNLTLKVLFHTRAELAHDDIWYSKDITTLPYADSLPTLLATDDHYPTCGTAARTVWYHYTAPYDGILRITTAGSDFDTVLSVWTGTPIDLLPAACNDDADGGLQSRIDYPTTRYETYYIQVGGYNGGGGFLRFSVSLTGLDRNNDGVVSPSDALFVINRLNTTDPEADVDGDGMVTEADVALVMDYLGVTETP